MGGIYCASLFHGAPEPLPPAVSMPPSASADAYLCSSTCADRPMEHDPTVEMARHFGPPIVIGPIPPPPVVYVHVPSAPVVARQTAIQGSPQAQKQAGSRGAKASKPKAQKAPKAPKQAKQPKAAKTTPAPAAAPTAAPAVLPTLVGQ